MTADKLTTSFGDPNVVPSTPKETPTSCEFPPSIFETPKGNRGNQGSFEALSRWTPQSVEEFAVFGTADGDLRGITGPFSDLPVSTTPYQLSSNHKRLLSAKSATASLTSHRNLYSPTLALSLPPVDPSRRLPSSPTATRPFPSPIETDRLDGLQQRSGKKVRRGTLANTIVQTVTPPPSTHKKERWLAPKPQTSSMPTEEFENEFAANASQQQNILGNFANGPVDMFGLPLQATSTAPSLEDTQGFWDPGMSGIDIDFSIPLANAFNGTDHRPVASLDWGKNDDMFPETGIAPTKISDNLPQKKERLLAPKPASMPAVDASMTEAPVFAHSFDVPADDSFATLNPAGGVDPGLLFTRPPSSNMELAAFDPMAQPIFMDSFSSAPLPLPVTKETKRGQVRRSSSTREISKAKKDKRAPSSSPVKGSSRPGLLRSASETRARKPSRAMSLSSMAPLVAHGPAVPGALVPRPSGRVSPLKNHQRLPSLSSIPEHTGPRTRTSVRFTIDARGRARAETTVIVDEEQHTPTRRRRRGVGRGNEWDSSDDDSSSTDGEPIIIPSRNNSFALPETRAPLYTRPSHSSQKHASNSNASSLGIFYGGPSFSPDDAESDAETVTNVTVGNNRGDAMSELRKLREDRLRRMPNFNTSHQLPSGALPSASSIIPPATATQSEPVSTPSTTDRGNQIRCVCNTTFSHINGDGYMVQCESCEMWLHGKCVKITRQTLPRVYICAFCANTPSSHGVRGRGVRKGVEVSNARIPASSPLSHKSIRSFR